MLDALIPAFLRPESASVQAAKVDAIFIGLLLISSAIVLLVVGLVATFAILYRRGSSAKRGEMPTITKVPPFVTNSVVRLLVPSSIAVGSWSYRRGPIVMAPGPADNAKRMVGQPGMIRLRASACSDASEAETVYSVSSGARSGAGRSIRNALPAGTPQPRGSTPRTNEPLSIIHVQALLGSLARRRCSLAWRPGCR